MRYLSVLGFLIACIVPAGADGTSQTIAGYFKEICVIPSDPVAAAEKAATREEWREVEGSGQPRMFAVVYQWMVRPVSDPAVLVRIWIVKSTSTSGLACSVVAEGLSGSEISGSEIENELVAGLGMGPPEDRFLLKDGTRLHWGDQRAGTEVLVGSQGRNFHLIRINPSR